MKGKAGKCRLSCAVISVKPHISNRLFVALPELNVFFFSFLENRHRSVLLMCTWEELQGDYPEASVFLNLVSFILWDANQLVLRF